MTNEYSEWHAQLNLIIHKNIKYNIIFNITLLPI